MAVFGYKISSEEHGPLDLVRHAQRAEAVGFSFAAISDHYHPWIDKQGHSPFVWGVIGAIAQATQRITIGTAVTCPTIRTHPAIVAHAAATAACQLPGRFFLGVGTGENLNEHIVAEGWPPADIRLEMLEEAVDVIRDLWRGEQTSHRGNYYDLENARLYDVPADPPPIYVAASGPKALNLAGEIGDGLISLAPEADVLRKFDEAGGRGKPRLAEVTVCWAEAEEEARKTAHEWWPIAGVKGELMQELRTPAHFEQAAQMVDVEDASEGVACGPDPEVHLRQIKQFTDAGYTHVWVHQVGPDQDGFFDFYEKQVLPRLS